MKKILFLLTMISAGNMQSQILDDSIVQFVGYWELNETQVYRIDNEKYKVKDNDTVNRQSVSYDVEITVVDSTSTSYTLRWAYKNFDLKGIDSLTAKVMKITENMEIIYKTDELGVFREVLNFEEIKSVVDKTIGVFEEEMKETPNIQVILNQVKKTVASKESIESISMTEVQNFHKAFGVQMNINEVYNSETEVQNLYGGEPFSASLESEVVSVDKENETALVKIFTTVDSKQVTDATFSYLKAMAESMNAPPPKREELPDFDIQFRFATTIHLPSGWPLYAINIKEVSGGNITNVEQTEFTPK